MNHYLWISIVGDELSSGTVNQFGTFEMGATKVGIADSWATGIIIIAFSA